MPTVPSNDNGQDQPRSTPGDPYLMMAAASMYDQGRLTKEQITARQQAGDEFMQSATAMGDIGKLGQGFTAEGKTRSENVEDVRDTGKIGQADRAADVSLGKLKYQDVAYRMTMMKASRTKEAPSQMAKDLGYEDIDTAADQIAVGRAKKILGKR